jgi:transposase
MLTVGVDLGKRHSQFAVIDETGKVLVSRKLPNRKAIVQTFLRSLPGTVGQVGCETCINTYWLVEVVEEIGLTIVVGHALHLRLIAQSRVKTDKIDARIIGELLRIGFFPKITIPPKEIREVRELLRGRIKMSRSVTQAKNRLHGLLTRAGIDYEPGDMRGAGVEAWLMSLPLTPPQRFMADTFLKTWKDLKEQVGKVEAELVSQVHLVGPWATVVERLQTIPGVGLLTALLLFLELWDMDRFPSPKKLAAYVGLVPGVHQTGQTHHGTSLTKQGNTYVRWVLVQGAWSAVRWDARYRGMFEHYRIRHIPTRAIIPIARQILIDVYEVWKDGITYSELLERKKKRIA